MDIRKLIIAALFFLAATFGGSALHAQGTSPEIDTGTEIVLYEWSDGDKLIATGVKFKVDLAVGSQVVAFETTNSDGVTDATAVVVTIQVPDEMDVGNAGPDILIRFLAGKSINVTTYRRARTTPRSAFVDCTAAVSAKSNRLISTSVGVPISITLFVVAT